MTSVWRMNDKNRPVYDRERGEGSESKRKITEQYPIDNGTKGWS